MAASDHETVFTLEATPIKFGPGAADDAGWELKRLGVGRVMLVTDPGVRALGHPDRIKEIIEREGIEVVLYDKARVEPTVESFQDACDFALEAKVEGFVSVGGGSSIDTAKVSNLITTHPAPVMDYVNPPVGGGKKPPSPLRPTSRSRPPRAPARRRRPWPSSTSPTSTSRAASRTATCARRRASSTPSSCARSRPR